MQEPTPMQTDESTEVGSGLCILEVLPEELLLQICAHPVIYPPNVPLKDAYHPLLLTCHTFHRMLTSEPLCLQIYSTIWPFPSSSQTPVLQHLTWKQALKWRGGVTRKNAKTITLQSTQDNSKYRFEVDASLGDVYLKSLVEDYYSSPLLQFICNKTLKELQAMETASIVYVNVRDLILQKVVDYCKYHHHHPNAPGYVPLLSTDDIIPWDRDYLDVDQATLFEMLYAGRECKLPEEYERLIYKTFANMLKGKTWNEMRMTFNLGSPSSLFDKLDDEGVLKVFQFLNHSELMELQNYPRFNPLTQPFL